MRELLAPEMISWVTGPDGQVERLDGCDAYLTRVEAMDLPAADFSVELTQVPVAVGADLVLCMVEVKASRSERTLHNFAGHLMQVDSSQIAEWWMVDASRPRARLSGHPDCSTARRDDSDRCPPLADALGR